MNKNIQNAPIYRRAVLAYLRSYIAEHGWAPSIREIGDAVGLKSTSSVHLHLRGLERSGEISRAAGVGRAIRLNEEAA